MKNGMAAVGILMIGLVTIGIVNVINDATSGQELDYYALKNVTEAAMLDSTDVDFYKIYGLYRMDRELFAEAFLTRFANTVKVKNYTISMYDIVEVPPKVSVEVKTNTTQGFSGDVIEITNSIDAIIEDNRKTDIMDGVNADHIHWLNEYITKGYDATCKK